MKRKLILFAGIGIFILTSTFATGQQITVHGKIVDNATNVPVGYASVAVRGTSLGTTSNFDGVFHINVPFNTDSLSISCLGYKNYRMRVTDPKEQQYLIRLEPIAGMLNEVRIGPKGGINPAWAIMKKVVLHKSENDPDKLGSYQCEAYNRIELDATKVSASVLKKNAVKKVLALADSMKIRDGDDLPVLPLFLSETVSDYYCEQNPKRNHEVIKATKNHGVGFQDATLLSQLTGSTFQQYNFYKNFVSAVGKDFVSPLTDNWKGWYEYELESTDALIDGRPCYRIAFKPKRPKDLAFTGTVWIEKENYSLYVIKATIQPAVNLNFIHKIIIEQRMEGLKDRRPWLPVKTRISVEIDRISKNTSGLAAKLYTSISKVKINPVLPDHLFDERITINPEASNRTSNYWASVQPDSLTAGERSVYNLIDTVKQIPMVKNYLTIADLIINGYVRVGVISLGPILNTYALNNVEGNRIRLGFKTNTDFSKKWVFNGYFACGTKDDDFKYGLGVNYIFSRKPWTEAGLSFSHDLNQVALLSDSYLYQHNNFW